MKKRIISLVISVALGLTGCAHSGRQKRVDAMDDTLEAVTKAIDNGNTQELYELFAPVIRQQNENLDSDLSEFLDYFEGEYVSAKKTHSSQQDRSNEENLYKTRVIYSYEITTTVTEYEVTWLYNTEVFDDNYLGLMSLGVQKKAELSKESPMTPDIQGVYIISADDK